MTSLIQDLRYAARMLAKNPGFTVVAALTLALGIGLNTTVFSLVNAALLRPLPVEDQDSLVMLRAIRDDGGSTTSLSYPDFEYYREHNEVFSGMAAIGGVSVIFSEGGETGERINGYLVSGNYFDLLGVPLIHGRSFAPEEDRTLATHPVVVISYEFWQRRFGGSEGIVGRSISLNGLPFTVIGVAPPEFFGLDVRQSASVWVPTMTQPLIRPGETHLTRSHRWMKIIGRLKPGVGLEQAKANVAAMFAQLLEQFPGEFDGRRVNVEPLIGLPGDRRSVLTVFGMLMAVVGLVLLIACGNVANLFLERASAKRREVAVRLALGAGRSRIVRQFLTEGAIVGLLGGGLGFLLASWTAAALSAVRLPLAGALAIDMSPDYRVLLFTAGISMLTVLISTLAPALGAARQSVAPSLKQGGRDNGRRRAFSLRHGLVVSQVAFSLVLLVVAGLFVRNLEKAAGVDPGFRTENVLRMSTDLNLHGYSEEESRVFANEVLARVRGLPGVISAGLTDTPPFGFESRGTLLFPSGVPVDPSSRRYRASYMNITPGYVETMGMRILAGRAFEERDSASGRPVVIVSRELARRYWPGERAVGRLLKSPPRDFPFEVIGVVEDAKHQSITEDPAPFAYFSLDQHPAHDLTVMVRTEGAPAAMIAPVREVMANVDPAVTVFLVSSMKDWMGRALFLPRAGALLLAQFSLLGLILAASGIYGLVSYVVSRRTPEVGVRMALGALGPDVARMIVGYGLKLCLIGLAIGLLGAFAAARLVEGLLFEVSATDPLTFVTSALLFLAVAAVAAYIPALRATRINPVQALRYE